MEHMQIATAVYENGVLRLSGPLPNLADGDRVEIAVVRVVPIDRDAPEEVARRERFEKEHRERLAALPPDPDEMTYEEECQAFDEHRESNRKLFPPELKGITW
jgi:predicted DNA-binding antitoxin AbrB/MazE fold protein